MIEELPSLISTLGFPIAVVCYLFWERHFSTSRQVTALSENTEAIHELKEEMIRFTERCNGGKKT